MNSIDTSSMQEESSEKEISFTYHLKLPVIGMIVSGLANFFLLVTRRPDDGPTIILFFLLTIFLFLLSFSHIISQAVLQIVHGDASRTLRTFYISVVMAIGGTFLIGLQTLRQLQFIDIFLVVIFISLAVFYLIRRF